MYAQHEFAHKCTCKYTIFSPSATTPSPPPPRKKNHTHPDDSPYCAASNPDNDGLNFSPRKKRPMFLDQVTLVDVENPNNSNSVGHSAGGDKDKEDKKNPPPAHHENIKTSSTGRKPDSRYISERDR